MMWTRALLKQNAKVAFHRNYWSCVGVGVLTALLSGGIVIGNSGTGYNFEEQTQHYGDATIGSLMAQIPPAFFVVFLLALIVGLVIGFAVSILVSNVAEVGCCRYFLENREHKTPISQVFYGFQGGRYSNTVWMMFLRMLYIFGWTLLFVIPGIVKSYSYMIVPYILAENPELDRRRVFRLSSQMMHGHKWEAFVLALSFCGWVLLGIFSGNLVTIFYVNPYIHATMAEFYSALKAEASMKGIVQAGELPGVDIPEII